MFSTVFGDLQPVVSTIAINEEDDGEGDAVLDAELVQVHADLQEGAPLHISAVCDRKIHFTKDSIFWQ